MQVRRLRTAWKSSLKSLIKTVKWKWAISTLHFGAMQWFQCSRRISLKEGGTWKWPRLLRHPLFQSLTVERDYVVWCDPSRMFPSVAFEVNSNPELTKLCCSWLTNKLPGDNSRWNNRLCRCPLGSPTKTGRASKGSHNRLLFCTLPRWL